MIGWVDVEARAPTLVQRLLPGLSTLRHYRRGWPVSYTHLTLPTKA